MVAYDSQPNSVSTHYREGSLEIPLTAPSKSYRASVVRFSRRRTPLPVTAKKYSAGSEINSCSGDPKETLPAEIIDRRPLATE